MPPRPTSDPPCHHPVLRCRAATRRREPGKGNPTGITRIATGTLRAVEDLFSPGFLLWPLDSPMRYPSHALVAVIFIPHEPGTRTRTTIAIGVDSSAFVYSTFPRTKHQDSQGAPSPVGHMQSLHLSSSPFFQAGRGRVVPCPGRASITRLSHLAPPPLGNQ